MRRAAVRVLALLAGLGVGTGAAAQTRPAAVPVAAEAAVVYRGWSIQEAGGESNLSQLAFPIFIRTELTRDLGFSYLFNTASSTLDTGGAGSNELSGVTDGKLALDYTLPDPRFSLGLGVRVPTGESILTPGEETVAGVLIDRMLGFYVRRYGEGTDIELRGGYAAAMNRGVAVSVGAAFLVKGSFDVADPAASGLSSYDPGDEFAVFGAALYHLGATSIMTRVRFAAFGTDVRDGNPELDEGNQLAIDVTASQELFRGVLDAGVELLVKDETALFGEGGLVPLRDVGGNILRINADFNARLDARTTLGGFVGLGFFGENSTGAGDGFLFEIGPHATYALSPHLNLNGRWILMTGSTEDSTIDLSGNAVSVSVGLGGGR